MLPTVGAELFVIVSAPPDGNIADGSSVNDCTAYTPAAAARGAAIGCLAPADFSS